MLLKRAGGGALLTPSRRSWVQIQAGCLLLSRYTSFVSQSKRGLIGNYKLSVGMVVCLSVLGQLKWIIQGVMPLAL